MEGNAVSDDSVSVHTSAGEVSRVAVRVPPFWPNKPEIWFQQLEAQFHLNSITADSTKFWHVIAQLESRYAELVEDVIVRPPDTNKYTTIKAELIKRLSTSQQQKLRQLLEHEEMGDRTPSQFLRDLRKLAGTTVQNEFLRTLWLNRLPSAMQAILVTQADLSLEKQAEIADAIRETHSPIQISAMTTQVSAIEVLAEQLKKLTAQVNELSRGGSRFRSRNRSNSRNRRFPSHNRGESPTAENSECWYHRHFGIKARHCRPTCPKYNKQGNEETRH